MPGPLFTFGVPADNLLRRAALAAARPLLSWVLQADALREVYENAQDGSGDPFDIRVLRSMNIQAISPDEGPSPVPPEGPLVVVSNHPHGMLDGLLLGAMLHRVRGDVRLLASHLLAGVPEMRDSCFFVDPFGGRGAVARSRAGLRAAALWLRRGGSLVVFPSGEVAHRQRHDAVPIDSAWQTTAARLVLQTGAQVLPAFIFGRNRAVFYAAGRVHPLLRTALLGRELLNKRGQPVVVRFGTSIANRELGSDARSATDRMRAAVEALAQMPSDVAVQFERPAERQLRRSRPIAEVARGRRLCRNDLPADEISRLAGSCLIESGAFQVYCAEASRIPAVLREIGRLRAIAYRAVGEGTGRSLDLDAFDRRYLHLFSWDRQREQIVGAYRIGQTDRIVSSLGVSGLYTRTLFRYDRHLIERLSPALELGRSFVREEYQRNYNALLLLWKGIGRFIVRDPRYRVLFGPVSISARYSDSSHAMLMAFLEQNHLDRSLAELVEAINPAVRSAPVPLPAVLPRTIEEVSEVVSKLEADGKGMPVLLRQYLKLNARLIAFNVDPNFGDALDALMMVDLTKVDPLFLARYLGRQEADRFLAHHGQEDTGPAHQSEIA